MSRAPVLKEPVLDMDRLPQHVAIIMDGNGRWARRRGMSRVQGHRRGKDAVQAAVETAHRLGIPYLSLFAFSTENWQRPQTEVRALMRLLRRYLSAELKRMQEKQVRLRAIGDLARLPVPVRKDLEHAIDVTRDNRRLTVGLCVSYGGRQDIVAAMRTIAEDVRAGRIDPQQIDERLVSRCLGTGDMPDPDLLIRTSGEMRISNFFLWQLAYTEIYVTDTLWPDFGERDFIEALAEYQGRERRFGRTSAQREKERVRAAR
jgi:undecaprenyl diphosphate synthase